MPDFSFFETIAHPTQQEGSYPTFVANVIDCAKLSKDYDFVKSKDQIETHGAFVKLKQQSAGVFYERVYEFSFSLMYPRIILKLQKQLPVNYVDFYEFYEGLFNHYLMNKNTLSEHARMGMKFFICGIYGCMNNSVLYSRPDFQSIIATYGFNIMSQEFKRSNVISINTDTIYMMSSDWNKDKLRLENYGMGSVDVEVHSSAIFFGPKRYIFGGRTKGLQACKKVVDPIVDDIEYFEGKGTPAALTQAEILKRNEIIASFERPIPKEFIYDDGS